MAIAPVNQSDSNAGGFERLLLRLGANTEEGSLEYERLRRRLVKFFECNGCGDALHMADEVFDRVAKREDLEELRSVPEFAIGIARNVVRESHRKQQRECPIDGERAPRGADAEAEAIERIDKERTLAYLRKALARMDERDRSLVLGYYDDGGGKQAQRREELAASLGVQPNALRVRVARLRERLEAAVLECRRNLR